MHGMKNLKFMNLFAYFEPFLVILLKSG